MKNNKTYKQMYDELIQFRQKNIIPQDQLGENHHIKTKSLFPELINDKEQIIQSFVIGNVTYMPIMGDVDKDGSNYVRIYSMRNTVFDITHVIIQYTKTIDEENSFTPDMIIDHENITDAEIADAAAADKI